MPKKRKSRGRSKGGKGRGYLIQCSQCGALVPKDKAKRVSKFLSLMDPQLARELRSKGTILPREKVYKYYCVSCAVHHRVVKVRARNQRKRR